MSFRAPNILTLAYEKMNRQKYTSFPATFHGNSNTSLKSITLGQKSDEKIQFSVSDFIRYDLYKHTARQYDSLAFQFMSKELDAFPCWVIL
jgi:hypothetical protein